MDDLRVKGAFTHSHWLVSSDPHHALLYPRHWVSTEPWPYPCPQAPHTWMEETDKQMETLWPWHPRMVRRASCWKLCFVLGISWHQPGKVQGRPFQTEKGMEARGGLGYLKMLSNTDWLFHWVWLPSSYSIFKFIPHYLLVAILS